MKLLTATQAAYHACAIDGEGCIRIQCRKRSHYEPAVKVANTDIGFLSYLKETSGIGSLIPCKPPGPRCKPSWEWYVPCEHHRAYLAQILPYLVIKKERALLLIEFLQYHKTRGSGIISYSDHEHVMRQVICEEICELNKRGV